MQRIVKVTIRILFIIILCFLQIITTITKKSASITIKHVESLDCGIYTCKLHNSVSDVSVDFKLAVIGEILILL